MEESTTTIYDVARVAGVSMATVKPCSHGNANVKEKTVKKVLDAIEELDYRPNAVARGWQATYNDSWGCSPNKSTSPYC